MRITILTLCALLGLWALAGQGQELAAGWSKAHADLRNSNVHPTTGAIRSLDNTEFVVLFEEEWENGGAAHDQEGNSYFPATHTLFQLNKEGDWTSGPLSTEKHYGHAAVTDNGKVVVLSEHSLDVFDLATQTNITTSWDTIDYVLQGSSAVVVDGLIYVLNSDGEMMVFDFDLQLQAFNNASRYWDQSTSLDFCTPATDGQGTFYFFTESGDSGVVFAIRFPENELLWNRSMAGLDPLPSLGTYPTKGSPSLSEDGTRLFVPVATGGVVALDTSNGDLVWATAIADLSEGSYFSGKLVPTISPVDGAIITHWIQLPNDTVVVVGLDPETGEQVHLLKTLTNKGGDIFSPGAVSADGVYYFSVYGVMGAVDLESFELLWYREEEYGVDFQSISIAADGSVYFPLEWDSIAVLRCKDGFALDGSGTCSESCAHANARFIGRNLCGYDCGEEVAVLFPLEEPGCDACQENEFWSLEELACVDASSSSEDGDDKTTFCPAPLEGTLQSLSKVLWKPVVRTLSSKKMCEFIKEFGVIDGEYDEIVTALIAHCKRDQGEFHPSELYNRLEARKHVDQGKRRSLFKTLSDGESFRLAQALVDKLNAVDGCHNYFFLVRNNLTFIKYAEGDFFSAHEDFLSLSSNLLEEFTLILCVDADCEGGETVFHLNRFFTHTSKASITPKHAVLFRKDLCHEGALLRRGYKEILTFNLWATPRNSKSKSKSKSNNGKEDGKERLVVASFEGSEGQVYVMPLSNVMAFENKMAGYIRFRGLEEGRQPIINIHFGGEEEEESMGITHESFDTIYRIMMRMYVPQHQMDWQLVDYFNIDPKNVLLDVTVLSSSAAADACASSDTGSSSSSMELPTVEELKLRPFLNASAKEEDEEEDEEETRLHKRHRAVDDQKTTKPDNATFSVPTATKALLDLQDDILLVPTPEMVEYICSSCVAPNHLPFLPFLTVWVEGSYGYGGGMADTPPHFLDMQPVFASFGQSHNLLQRTPLATKVHDNNLWSVVEADEHLYSAEHVPHPTPVTLQDAKLTEEQKELLANGSLPYCEDGKTLFLCGDDLRWRSGEFHYGLEVACPKLNTSLLMRMLMVHHYNDTRLSDGTLLMRGVVPGTIFQGPFYNLDKEGRTYLSEKHHFQAALQRLDGLHFFDSLLAKLANGEAKSLNFPQAKHSFSQNFCNEDVYAALKITLICGFLRMV
ncbi:hypothetical protein QOT17_004064 [Balamuthia mandrillaris]